MGKSTKKDIIGTLTL